MYKVGMHLANNNVILPPQTNSQKKNNQFSPFFFKFPAKLDFFRVITGMHTTTTTEFFVFSSSKKGRKINRYKSLAIFFNKIIIKIINRIIK